MGDGEGNINFAPTDPNRVTAEGYEDTHIDAGVEPGARKEKPDRRGPVRRVAEAVQSRFTRGRRNVDAADAGEAPKVGKKTEAKEEEKSEKADTQAKKDSKKSDSTKSDQKS